MTNNSIRGIDINKRAPTLKFSLIRQPKSLSFNCYLLSLLICSVLIGCSTTQPPVPVVDRVKPDSSSLTTQPTEASNLANQFYIVQKGDTLYSIALNNGVDFKTLAEWNGIVDPKSIRTGQRINLSAPAGGSQPTLFAVPQQPIETTIEPSVQSPVAVSQERDTSRANLKTSPKVLKLPFSEQNVARLKYPANMPPSAHTTSFSPTVEKNSRIEVAPPPPQSQKSDKAIKQSEAEWIWPTAGKLSSSFSKNSKGVKISGQAGQPILASAAGEVVYSGHGLRGYGNLIIIKHNNTFLSAYAHNSKILVKEGETVQKGQKIAEMGNTDTDTIQLHFEIRKHGKPVDPMEYLPNQS